MPTRNDVIAAAADRLQNDSPAGDSPTPTAPEPTGDAAPRTSHEEASHATPTGQTERSEQPTREPTQEEDDLPASIKDLLAKNPDSKDIVRLVERELKSQWTPKLQEAAEIRKQREAQQAAQEAVPDYARSFSEKLSTAYQIDPTGNLAATLILNAAQKLQELSGQQAPAAAPGYASNPPPQQYDQYGYPVQDQTAYYGQDPAYQHLQQQYEAEKRQRAALEAQRHLETMERQAHTEFDQIEQKYGVKIPTHERELTTIWSMQQGFPNPWSAWEFKNSERLIQAKVDRAREEAAAITAQKATLTAPSTIPDRSVPSENTPKGRRALVEYHARKLAGGG